MTGEYILLERDQLLHRELTVLEELADASKLLTNFLNALGRPVSYSMEPLHTLFHLVMSTFTGGNVLKVDKTRNYWNAIMNRGVESLYEEDKSLKRARYTSSKELLLNCMENDSMRVWSAMQSTELYVRLGWVGAMLNLDVGQKDKV